jgi:hypothetical protein
MKIINYKNVDMTNLEYEEYEKIVKQFTTNKVSGSVHFVDMFETDGDGCISIIKVSSEKQVPWVVIVFLQNLMINQRLRRMEKWVQESMLRKN